MNDTARTLDYTTRVLSDHFGTIKYTTIVTHQGIKTKALMINFDVIVCASKKLYPPLYP